MSNPRIIAGITVELFGTARLKAGVQELELSVRSPVTVSNIMEAMANICPSLIGDIISHDRSELVNSHILNLNGLSFVNSDPIDLKTGDKLLLFSSQAGG